MIEDDPPLLSGAPDALQALSRTARDELAALSYPDRIWLPAPAAGDEHNVLIVGGGQSALGIAARLRRDGIDGVTLIDRSPAGFEGVWETYARMPELRTPKLLNGLDLGLPSLSVQRWYETCHGADAWRGIDRIQRSRWMAYLRWYRETMEIQIRNDAEVVDVSASGDGNMPLRVDVTQDGVATVHRARVVVLATGHDGGGRWRVPDHIASSVPADLLDHSNGPIDFSRMVGKRIGVLGHGASAFDNAVAALQAGAVSVDLCFRRNELPRVNPHRHIETAGLLTHYAQLSDATRWQVARHFRQFDQPPPRGSFLRAHSMPGFAMHAGCPWHSARLADDGLHVDTGHGPFVFDHLICATGLAPDLAARKELRTLAARVQCWRHRYQPPAGLDEGDDALAAYPYLGPEYQFTSLDPAEQWVSRVFAFNGASYVSHGPHSTSISGHKHALPRLVQGVTRRLFIDLEPALVDELRRYDHAELVWPPNDDHDVAAPSGSKR